MKIRCNNCCFARCDFNRLFRLFSDSMSVIEEATYSGILLPGNEWKALSHLGHTARMAYRVRVRCDRNYYGQTCTKLCKPRDDRFGHYTCGDTDGRKECIPGWQGETCDKGALNRLKCCTYCTIVYIMLRTHKYCNNYG